MPVQVHLASAVTQNIQGTGAHDGTTVQNPVIIGAKAVNVMPAAVSATNDTTQLYASMGGALIVKPFSIPEADWSFACATGGIIVNTDVVVKAAAAAGVRNYVTGITVQNVHASVATEWVVKDGSTVIFRGFAPANMNNVIEIEFNTPIRGNAATAVNFQCITAGAQVYANIQGYVAP